MKSIELRKAKIKDARRIKNLLYRMIKEEYKECPSIFMPPNIKNELSIKKLKKNINSKNDIIYVACIDNIIIGVITTGVKKGLKSINNNKHGMLIRLYVIKKQRRKGVATRLINKCKKYYSNKGIDEVRLSVFGYNKKALKLYTKLGYTYYFSLMSDKAHEIKII
ncbi:MAG: GNAT family N-acetyltransferase [Candidatus Sedimenticola sp. (ex Thyasira tokunagai)]